jgi:hypothetical protein
MNTSISVLQSDTRKGDITLSPGPNQNFAGGDAYYETEAFVAFVGNNSGTPAAYLPDSITRPSPYVILDFPQSTAGSAASPNVVLQVPDTGENCNVKMMGTGNAGDPVVLAAIPVNGVLTGTSEASPDVFTATAAHGLDVGNVITIAGVTSDTNANGTFFVKTIPSPTTFTVSATLGGAAIAGAGSAGSGGTFTANVGNAGKLRSFIGNLAPTVPGPIWRFGYAEQSFVDDQVTKVRFSAGTERTKSTFTATGTEATDIQALKAILEAQGLVV